jgi:hypothetical protein
VNERSVQLYMYYQLASGIACAAPNYTPRHWWECDLWTVTRAGYVVEYEIKLSLHDFGADESKEKLVYTAGSKSHQMEKKHLLLQSRDERGPSRFFYVVSADIADKVMELLPDWAGLISVSWSDSYRCCDRIKWLKEAPQLHRKKVNRREIEIARSRMWIRYWRTLARCNQLNLDPHGESA